MALSALARKNVITFSVTVTMQLGLSTTVVKPVIIIITVTIIIITALLLKTTTTPLNEQRIFNCFAIASSSIK